MNNFTSKKKIIAVLGMGRSGTSVVTKALDILGIDLGNNFMPTVEAWNPKGFLENQDIYSINEKIFASLNLTWDNIHLNTMTLNINDPRLAEHTLAARKIITSHLTDKNCWAFKDPRTTRLLPFWQEQFATLKLEDEYIIVIRNPLSSAISFKKLLNIDIEKSMLIWLHNTIPIINLTNNKKRLVISYELLMENPLKEIHRIKDTLAINHPINEQAINQYINDFLTADLNHHATTFEAFATHPATPKLCVKAYEMLNKLARDEISPDSHFTTSWDSITDNFYNLAPSYQYIDQLLNVNANLNQEIKLLRTQHKNSDERINQLEKYIDLITLKGLLKTPIKLTYQTLCNIKMKLRNIARS